MLTTWVTLYIHPALWLFPYQVKQEYQRFKNRRRTILHNAELAKDLGTGGVYRYQYFVNYLTFGPLTVRVKTWSKTAAYYLVDAQGNLKVNRGSDRYYELLNECI